MFFLKKSSQLLLTATIIIGSSVTNSAPLSMGKNMSKITLDQINTVGLDNETVAAIQDLFNHINKGDYELKGIHNPKPVVQVLGGNGSLEILPSPIARSKTPIKNDSIIEYAEFTETDKVERFKVNTPGIMSITNVIITVGNDVIKLPITGIPSAYFVRSNTNPNIYNVNLDTKTPSITPNTLDVNGKPLVTLADLVNWDMSAKFHITLSGMADISNGSFTIHSSSVRMDSVIESTGSPVNMLNPPFTDWWHLTKDGTISYDIKVQ